MSRETEIEFATVSSDLALSMRKSGVWKEACCLPMERLRQVKVAYFDFAGQVQADGLVVTLDVVAPAVANIFKELLDLKFPIAKICTMDLYGGDDQLSMEDNNSSCFNCRSTSDTTLISLHSYGLALDINPKQNPVIYPAAGDREKLICPSFGQDYLDRQNLRPGMVEKVVSVFESNGFSAWGGNWTSPIDYHHFQVPRFLAELLVAVSIEDANALFDLCLKSRIRQEDLPDCSQLPKWQDYYALGREVFFDYFGNYVLRR